MAKKPIIPDVFEDWIEEQKAKPVKARSGFIAERKTWAESGLGSNPAEF